MAREMMKDNLNVKRVAGSTLWFGRTFSQYLIKPFTQKICPICNNFEPRGHPTSSDRTWGFMEDSESSPESRAKLYDGRVWLEMEYELKSMTDRAISSRPCEYCIALVGIIKFLVPEWLTPNDTTHISIIDFSFLEGSCPRVGIRSRTTDFKLSFELFRGIDCPTRSWSKLPNLPKGRSRSVRSETRPVWQFAHECYLTCLNEHPKCKKPNILPFSRDLPTRLLFIGEENDEIRLWESSQESIAMYTALSYSWGGCKSLQTMKSNIDELKISVPWSELGAVFQDAITSTRYMGLKYVWIDALCIIQDDKSDWEKESARMGDIYAEAFVTFIAASSPNVDTPFLTSRAREWQDNTANLKEPDGTDSHIRFRRLATPDATLKYGPSRAKFMENDSWPAGSVYRRGWCYQEALLSPRVLHFTDGSLIWECSTVRRAEDELPPYASTIPIYEPSSMIKFNHTWLQVSWLNAVSSYTSREITYDADTLPAIAGIAATFACNERGQYLAGLWESCLLHDLTWNRAVGHPCRPVEKYVAPSWSWASVRCRTIWNLWDVGEIYASIVSASTTISGENPFGEVSDGEVLINASTVSVLVTHDVQRRFILKHNDQAEDVRLFLDCPIYPTNGICTDGSTEPTSRRAVSTESRDWTLSQIQSMDENLMRVHVMPLFHARDFGVVSLVLGRSTTIPGAFVRLGVCFSFPKTWLPKQPRTTTRIV